MTTPRRATRRRARRRRLSRSPPRRPSPTARCVGGHHPRRRPGHRRGHDRPRLHLRPARGRHCVAETLADVVGGTDPMAAGAAWAAMAHAVRNHGPRGTASSAIAAVDVALWDLKARRSASPSPTCSAASTTRPRLRQRRLHQPERRRAGRAARRLGGAGPRRGEDEGRAGAGRDPPRVATARRASATTSRSSSTPTARTRARRRCCSPTRSPISASRWFEEPVSSDDLDGLRAGAGPRPPGMEVTAGEYGYDLPYFRRMLDAGAVDCLQADVTRCGGITALLRVGALTDGRRIDLSSHTAPQVSAHACCGALAPPPPRVLRRPRARRVAALRRRLEPHDGASVPTPTARSRARAQARRRRTVPPMSG